jgi:hypothetical protein
LGASGRLSPFNASVASRQQTSLLKLRTQDRLHRQYYVISKLKEPLQSEKHIYFSKHQITGEKMADIDLILNTLLTSTRFILLTTVVILAGEIWLFLNLSEISKKMDELEKSIAKKRGKK